MSESKVPIPPKVTAESLRFISFNVCGLRNVMNYEPWSHNKTLSYMFSQFQGDIMCFQEVRIQEKDVPYNFAVVPGYSGYYSFPHSKKGYSGVAIYVKNGVPIYHAEDGLTGWLNSKDYIGKTYQELEKGDLHELSRDKISSEEPDKRPLSRCIGGYPKNITESVGKEIDSEGRSVVLDLGFCVVLGLYCPANSLGNKEEYRTNYFQALDERIENLIAMGREVIVMGDMNIARDIYDSCDGLDEYFKSKNSSSTRVSSTIEKFRTTHPAAVKNWRESTPQRLLLNEWLGATQRNLKGSLSLPSSLELTQKPQVKQNKMLHDVCREKHPDRMFMYTCEYGYLFQLYKS